MSLDWMTAAVCAGVDPELWFPETGDSRPARICQGCPVRQQCEEYAAVLEGDCGLPYRHGVWGGTSAKERAAARDQASTLKDGRDAQILRLAEHGVGPKEIASLVGVTTRTVHRVKQHAA
ncbi:WhiB family transcriptional regulator [Streptomyces sp. NPDC090126]|uniref:WhiB family transcriptional regulator n=1 Tax=Streptomyces sp. NPDC090126 TaxID=3365952 RepID=UPI00382CC33E